MKMFLCHSSSDKAAVRALYKRLQNDGLDPWLDEENLLPGQDWEREIEKAVREADVVLACLSREAVSKKGFVQKEIKFALDVVDLQPEGTIYLIPAKLEECDVPERLSEWQWVNLFEETGYEKLLRALQPDMPQELRNSLGMEFVLIPAGSFLMGSTGSPEGDDDERPIHEVRISHPFYLGKYPVTQGQCEAVTENNPSHFKGDANRPVENISWKDVQAFLRRLNEKEGGAFYRLPTEAEWEYAARAGSTTAYCFGDDESQLGEYAWYAVNSNFTTHPVGQLKPNPWGLYDMHGNVFEWVQDWYQEDYYKSTSLQDPQGPEDGMLKIIRGGAWSFNGKRARLPNRDGGDPEVRSFSFGFRLVRAAL